MTQGDTRWGIRRGRRGRKKGEERGEDGGEGKGEEEGEGKRRGERQNTCVSKKRLLITSLYTTTRGIPSFLPSSLYPFFFSYLTEPESDPLTLRLSSPLLAPVSLALPPALLARLERLERPLCPFTDPPFLVFDARGALPTLPTLPPLAVPPALFPPALLPGSTPALPSSLLPEAGSFFREVPPPGDDVPSVGPGEGRRKKDEGRRKKDEGRRKKE